VAVPGHRRARRRSRVAFAVWTALVLVLALGVGVTAWWLGSGRWTAVPSLVGVQRDVAEHLLATAELVPAARTVYAAGVPAGQVTGTDPAPAARLLRGSTVTMVVSRGDPTVPAIGAGAAVADARAAIRAAGLSPVQATGAAEYSDSVQTGAVVRTEPAAGTPLPPGGKVTLVLSRGVQPPRQVRVPFVVGKTFDEAQEILSDVGLEAEEHPGFGGFGRENGRVVDQSNGAGSMVDRGTTIELETL
jgi:beta-lactam-binding protein with PASTA domain